MFQTTNQLFYMFYVVLYTCRFPRIVDIWSHVKFLEATEFGIIIHTLSIVKYTITYDKSIRCHFIPWCYSTLLIYVAKTINFPPLCFLPPPFHCGDENFQGVCCGPDGLGFLLPCPIPSHSMVPSWTCIYNHGFWAGCLIWKGDGMGLLGGSHCGNLLDISPSHTASKRTHKVAVLYTMKIEHRTQTNMVLSNRKFILWTCAVDLFHMPGKSFILWIANLRYSTIILHHNPIHGKKVVISKCITMVIPWYCHLTYISIYIIWLYHTIYIYIVYTIYIYR